MGHEGADVSSDPHGPARIFATVWSNTKRVVSRAASLPVVDKEHGGANTRLRFAQVSAQQVEREPFQQFLNYYLELCTMQHTQKRRWLRSGAKCAPRWPRRS